MTPLPLGCALHAAAVGIAVGCAIGTLAVCALVGGAHPLKPGSGRLAVALLLGAMLQLSGGVLMGRALAGRARAAPGLLLGLGGALATGLALLGSHLLDPYQWRGRTEELVLMAGVACGAPALLAAVALVRAGAAAWSAPLPPLPGSAARLRRWAAAWLVLLFAGAVPLLVMPRCLAAGTLVDTPDGARPIEALRAGDRVWSIGPGGRRGVGTVVATAAHTAWRHHRLVLADGAELRATGEHPVRANGRWVRVAELDAGASLATPSASACVRRHEVVLGLARVHDLAVEPWANFIAGGVVVHNKSPLNREMSAIGTLRSLSTAQAQFQAQGLVDQDGDGIGEFGFLGELAGASPCRGTGASTAALPFVSAVLGTRDARGIATKGGYHFLVYLPGAAAALTEGAGPGAAPVRPAAADAQEQRWCAYAWPVDARDPLTRRVFFVSHHGDVLASDNRAPGQGYAGTTRIPRPDAALDTLGPAPGNLDAGVAYATTGLATGDGGGWVPAGS